MHKSGGAKQRIITATVTIMATTSNTTLEVTEIVKLAGVHRSSFYRYFSSLDAVVEQAIAQQLPDLTVEKDDFNAMMAKILQTLEEDILFFQNCLQYQSEFEYQYRKICLMLINTAKPATTPPLDFVTEELSYRALSGIFAGWLKNPNQIGKDDLSRFIRAILMTTFSKAI